MTEIIIKNQPLIDLINLNCVFYENCTLPKRNSLCSNFPDFTICPEYQAKRKKLAFLA